MSLHARLEPRATSVNFCPENKLLSGYLELSSMRHNHLCPRQVLGARLGLYGLRALGLVDHDYEPRFFNYSKRLLAIVESDGCGTDGMAVTTSCYVGKRTLRVLDFGKLAVTLVDVATGRAVRLAPRPESRRLSRLYAPQAQSRWHGYLDAYKVIPDEELMSLKNVKLKRSLTEILSRPDARVTCELCGEEVINEREVISNGRTFCRPCRGEKYYQEL